MRQDTSQSQTTSRGRLCLTGLEVVFNRIFAVLLVLATVPLFLNPLNIPTMAFFGVFALFLFFSKKYHPIINIIFLLFALGVYFLPLPINWGLYLNFRELKFNGYQFYQFTVVFYLSAFIFVSFSVRNVIGNISAYFNPSTSRRNLIYFISLIIVMITILAYPFLGSIKLRHKAMENSVGNSALSLAIVKQELIVKPRENASSSALARKVFTANFESAVNKYIYRLTLAAPIADSITFTAVKADGEKINFIDDRRIECAHCQTDSGNPDSLVFPAGQDVDFIFSSDEFIKKIEFTESNSSTVEFVFWR